MHRSLDAVLKVVVDTSVFVAGLRTSTPTSASYQVISAWRAGGFTLVMAPELLRELVGKLMVLGQPEDEIAELVQLIGQIALRIPGAYQSSRLDKVDKTDNKFLAAAYEAKADFLVSLDKKSLLPMKHFYKTQIVSPDIFMRLLVGNSEK